MPPTFKVTANPNLQIVTEQQIFHLLDHLRPTADGADQIPSWFLRLLAPIICGWIVWLVNLSLCRSWVPSQWKQAIIRPVPKTKAPQQPSEYRPISVLPVLSRMVERLVVNNYIYPALLQQPMSSSIEDQFAFRPTGSTTAAVSDLLQQITNLLKDNEYVVLVSMDFSRAFDTVRHDILMQKILPMDIPDNIFNWLINYFAGRCHATKLWDIISMIAFINASIVQGSVVGPASYVIVASDLKPIHRNNKMMKYADDTYLLVASRYINTDQEEFDNISQWAERNNLKLNASKTKELIIFRRRSKALGPKDPIVKGAERVTTMRVLGVIIKSKLSMSDHLAHLLSSSASSIHALRMLRAHGLREQQMHVVATMTTLASLMYASPSWWDTPPPTT